MDPLIIGPLDLIAISEASEAEFRRLDAQRRAALSQAIRELKAQLKTDHVD